jgi:hypothetical protein
MLSSPRGRSSQECCCRSCQIFGGLPSLFALRRFGTQPQRDVGWLRRLAYHAYQIFVQVLQIPLVPQLGGEGFQSLSGIVLLSVEAAVDERLDATTQRDKQGSYG